MDVNNLTDLRAELEKVSSPQLAEMLQAETEKEAPNDELVLLILHILEDRESDKPVELSPKELTAWKKYQAKVKARARNTSTGWKRVLKAAASMVVIIGILFAIVPQQAEAETFWEKLMRWTESVVEFFGPRDNEGRLMEYEFKTDNPGLQQVYDAVVEMGVTVPVVPMWLPEGSELVEFKIEESPATTWLHCRFAFGGGEIIYSIDIYNEEVSHKYQKDENSAIIFEKSGTVHRLMRNFDRLVAVWTSDNVECSMVIDSQEDTLYRIIESIYVMEDE